MSSSKLGYLIQHVSTVLARQTDQVLQERLGIGFSQFKLMMVLDKNPNIQQKQIADALGQTEASISRQIKLLAGQGLLQFQVRPENRREHITTLTARGMRFTQEANRILDTYHGPVFDSLSDKQQRQLTELLGVLHEQACKPGRVSVGSHILDI